MTPNLKRVIRLDSVPIEKAQYTEEGYLIDRPVLTSTGIFEYVNPDGTLRHELRLPEEVFDPESLASYKSKPVIITHDAGLITKDNVAEEGIGTILSEGFRDGDDVRAEIVIHDTDSLKDCRMKELSLGYNLDLDETPGVWKGQRYDAIQRNIRINHLAIVKEARAGDQARLNIDGRNNKTLTGGAVGMKKTTKKTKKSRVDGILSPEELAKAVEEYKAKRAKATDGEDEEVVSTPPTAVAQDDDDTVTEVPATAEDAEEEVAEMRDKMNEDGDLSPEEIKRLLDMLDTFIAKAQFDCNTDGDEDEDPTAVQADGENCEECMDEDDVPADAKAENEDGEDEEEHEDDEDEVIPTATEGEVNMDSIDRLIRQRLTIRDMAQKLNLDGLESMPIKAARKAVIKAVRPDLRLDGKSAAYINATFDYAVSEVNNRTRKDTGYQKRQMFNKDSAAAKRDSASGAEAARERMIARRNNKKEGK